MNSGKTKPGNSRNQGTIGNPKIMRKDLGDWQSAAERNKSWMVWGEEQSLVRATALHNPKEPAIICLEFPAEVLPELCRAVPWVKARAGSSLG